MSGFKMWEITYIPTGKVNKTDYVCISTGDTIRDITVRDMFDCIAYFEAWAADEWKTYETKYAITQIRLVYEN